jgi:hypothetical protein
VLVFRKVITKKAYPAMLPALSLKNLRKLRLHGSHLPVQEYALLEVGLEDVEDAIWNAYKTDAERRIDLDPYDSRAHLPLEVLRAEYPEVMVDYEGKRTIENPTSLWYEFTGKGERRINCGTAKSEARCRDYARRDEEMKQAARVLIKHDPWN